jgi:hypothetical protein
MLVTIASRPQAINDVARAGCNFLIPPHLEVRRRVVVALQKVPNMTQNTNNGPITAPVADETVIPANQPMIVQPVKGDAAQVETAG